MSKRMPPLTLSLDSQRIKTRLANRLAELGKTARGASREANLSDSAIRNIMEGKSKSPRLDTIMSLARVLDVEPDWFIDSAAESKDPNLSQNAAKVLGFLKDQGEVIKDRKYVDNINDNMVVVLIPNLNEEGEYVYSSDTLYLAVNPILNEYGKDVELILVKNDTMWPIFKSDDMLLLSVNVPLCLDEDFMFMKSGDGGSITARLARLLHMNDDELVVQTFNPPSEHRLPRSQWDRAHKIIKRFPSGRMR